MLAARPEVAVVRVVVSVAGQALPIDRRDGLAAGCRLAMAGFAGHTRMAAVERVLRLRRVVELAQYVFSLGKSDDSLSQVDLFDHSKMQALH